MDDIHTIDARQQIQYIKDQTCRKDGASMPVSLLTMKLYLPGCASLKEKRGKIKPVLARLRKEFNVATAELDLQDVWQNALLGCATVSADAAQNQRLLQQVVEFVERGWVEIEVEEYQIEIL